MSAPPKTRRQLHGIRAQNVTVSLGDEHMARLRKEARRQGISLSAHIATLIRLAWAMRDATGEQEVA